MNIKQIALIVLCSVPALISSYPAAQLVFAQQQQQQKQQEQTQDQNQTQDQTNTEAKDDTAEAAKPKPKQYDHERICPRGCNGPGRLCPSDREDVARGIILPCQRCGQAHL